MARIEVRPELRYAWHGPSMLVTTPRVECGAEQPLAGYWFREARHLATLRLEIDGYQPWLCESAVLRAERLHATFIHPELVRFAGGGSARAGQDAGEDSRHASGLPYRAVDLRVDVTVRIAALDITLSVANRARTDLEFQLAWVLDADFVDLLQVNGEGDGSTVPRRVECAENELRFIRDDPALPLETRIHAAGPHRWEARDDGLTLRLRLARGEGLVLPLRVEAIDPATPMPDEGACEARWRDWSEGLTEIRAGGDPAIDRIVRENVADIASFPLLEGREEEWLAPQAGVPLYPALFGRDAVTAAWQSAMLDRGEMLDAVLTRLGRVQGTKDDPAHAEQPGRILQQARRGPLSRLGVLPYGAYYGDFASPLMFVIGLAHLYAWCGDRTRLTAHWDSARRVLDWARERGDRD
ncbi:MAG TPA: glycogen debranching N-terminal domain-containing protein, partial [Gemmatimonadaceae bacterium]|nr:glycogen debranching N-terminal domain-containing protein [Gemmatimonadaceae bacterium]